MNVQVPDLWDVINLNSFILLGILGGMISLYIFIRTYAKKGGNEAAAESNELLRKLVDDQAKEIDRMRTGNHERDQSINALSLDVERLKAAKDGLANMITVALVEYFRSDPTIAKAAEKLIDDSKKEVRA